MKYDDFIRMQEQTVLNQAMQILEARFSEELGSDTILLGHLFIRENAVWMREHSNEFVFPERKLTDDPHCVMMVRGIRALFHEGAVVAGECWEGYEDYAEGREELL